MEHEDVCVVLQLPGDVFVHPEPSHRGTQVYLTQGKWVLEIEREGEREGEGEIEREREGERRREREREREIEREREGEGERGG